jgi:ResB-like family
MSTEPIPHAAGEHGEPAPRAAGPGSLGSVVRKVLKPIASLQLTVVLFVLSLGLVFFGTLAQIDNGIWTVVDKYFWSWGVWVPNEIFYKFLSVFWKEAAPPSPTGEVTWPGGFPFPAGKLLGALMLLNLLAAHALRFRLSWKRTGIFLIHFGLILLFVGELVTREFAVEQRMTIDEGRSVSYAEDSRYVELALVDGSDPKQDRVAVVPQALLARGAGRITDERLPIDIEVLEFMPNSALVPVKPGGTNTADRGIGTGAVAEPRAEVSGVDPNQKIDVPSAYVRLFKKGTNEMLGTHLVSLDGNNKFGADEIEVGGTKYQMSMRFKRYYKEHRFHLDKFRFDRYMGTEKAKNYSSDVRVYDAEGRLVREQRISMNDPLRIGGETFYQSSFDEKTEATTVLQVVKNPGWLLPYASCALVSVGLVLHFGIFLVQFLSRTRTKPAARAPELLPVPARTGPARFVPLVALAIVALYLVGAFARMTPPKQVVDLDAVGRLPVVDGGRVKPLDSVARLNMRSISGREEYYDADGKKRPSIQWLMEVMANRPENAYGDFGEREFVRIDNEAVLRELRLENRDGFRYTLKELWPKRGLIEDRVDPIYAKVRANQKLDTTETKFKELHERLTTILMLSSFGGPKGGLLLLPPVAGGEWESLYKFNATAASETLLVGLRAQKKHMPPLPLSPEAEEKLLRVVFKVPLEQVDPRQRAEFLATIADALQRDPADVPANTRRALFETVALLLTPEQNAEARAALDRERDVRLAPRPAARVWDRIVSAYADATYSAKRAADLRAKATLTEAEKKQLAELDEERSKAAGEFAAAVADYSAHLEQVPSGDLRRARAEVMYNRLAPFFHCTGLYVFAFVLAVVGFVCQAAQRPTWATGLRRGAFAVAAATLVVHTVALLARMYIMDRPLVFVTNLYSSAVFIGWGCVALCLAVERIFPIGIGTAVAAMLGLATSIVAHNLATDDTLEMMQAVLDTNFWLATHVTTVTLGYTATFVAGFFGALYVFQMLGAVVRDSFKMTGEPSVGALLAFGAAATGVVAVPLVFLAFAVSAAPRGCCGAGSTFCSRSASCTHSR